VAGAGGRVAVQSGRNRSMSFASLHFAVFLPLVVLGYFHLPLRFRWLLLLVASWYFYACWEPIFLLLLLYSTAASWAGGFAIAGASTRRAAKAWLWVAVVAIVAPLFLFKYFNFVNAQLATLLALHEPRAFNIQFVLPLGISFFTFQALSYVIDVYRNDIPAERHFGVYALYKAFFPQLVAGPIERATRLLRTIQRLARDPASPEFAFDAARISSGLRLMLWGFFKKLVIADNLALLVDEIYAGPTAYDGRLLIVATYAFAFQIYCDFSGYSDIARGIARIFGIELMLNFRRPYAAANVQEFWRRWHISLSSWFRDYVYLPLGGNQVALSRWILNIFVVFVLSGIWHGANWTFVAWGALHGAYFVAGRLTGPIRAPVAALLGRVPGLLPTVRVFVTFHLIVIAWIFFRADSLTSALVILDKTLADWLNFFGALARAIFYAPIDARWATIITDNYRISAAELFLIWNPMTKALVAAILVMELVEWLGERTGAGRWLPHSPPALRWSGYAVLLAAIVVLAPFGTNQFIYFQF
jgi:D-alanyl-lipoteichoic acid acyltransferase DltB (MBOAT superfamily)